MKTLPRKPRYLDGVEIDIILKKSEPGSALGVSIRLALFAGLRIHEISKVTRTDIKRALQSGMFHVRKDVAKYQKPRTIPVCGKLADSLAMWYNRHNTVRVKHISLWNCSMRTVQRRFSEYSIVTVESWTPHDLRHTFACSLYSKCRDLSLVQAALGHANLKTTLVYVHIEGIIQQEIEEAYDRFIKMPERKKYNDKIK